jgi:Resolvase, N terminal domain
LPAASPHDTARLISTYPRPWTGGEDQSFAILRPLIAQVQVHSNRIDVDLWAAMVAQAAVSFVSIIQAFNTTTSMGRLTLNVLLSFAQFEREVTGERIRDKIAASKKKGLWMGGQARAWLRRQKQEAHHERGGGRNGPDDLSPMSRARLGPRIESLARPSVAPRAGAWIETTVRSQQAPSCRSRKVAPRAGAWI